MEQINFRKKNEVNRKAGIEFDFFMQSTRKKINDL